MTNPGGTQQGTPSPQSQGSTNADTANTGTQPQGTPQGPTGNAPAPGATAGQAARVAGTGQPTTRDRQDAANDNAPREPNPNDQHVASTHGREAGIVESVVAERRIQQ